jgi:hypothetical protein
VSDEIAQAVAAYGWVPWTEGRWARRRGGREPVIARRRDRETSVEFINRLRWGRIDELACDFAADLAGRIPDGTLNTYRSDLNAILLPRIGDHWLVDCDNEAHANLVDSITTEANLIRLRAGERTLGALITWAHNKRRWPDDRPAFGGREPRAARVKSKVSATPVDVADVKSLITLEDCPTFNETAAYGEAVGDAAAQQWGEAARILGELPKVQYLIGGRISATFASHASGWHRALQSVHIVFQVNRSRSWPTLTTELDRFKPPLILDKAKMPEGRYARVWEWAVPYLDEFYLRAARERGGWAFATLIDSKRPLDRVEKLLRDVRADPTVNYPWTSHWHRHAYASVNMASREDGGHNRSPATVAGWLGDGIEVVERTYWHGAGEPEPGWSSTPPAPRNTR